MIEFPEEDGDQYPTCLEFTALCDAVERRNRFRRKTARTGWQVKLHTKREKFCMITISDGERIVATEGIPNGDVRGLEDAARKIKRAVIL